MEKSAKIYIAGSHTMIGAAILRELDRNGYYNIVGNSNEEPLLTDLTQVDAFFGRTAPEYVFMAAGRSGGITANQNYPAELMLDNLLVGSHIIKSAHRYGVKKLLYLASSCSYPKCCAQPMKEDALLSGALEPTSEAYAIAKIAGIKLCQAYNNQYGVNFVSGIPANAFGPVDDFSPENSHVIAALMKRMHEAKLQNAKSINIWGTGVARREFIFVDDLANACILVMSEYDDLLPINLGCGIDMSILELADAIKEVTGFNGQLRFDASKPDGMAMKLLDSSKLRALGWRPRFDFREALVKTYEWFLESSYCD